MAHAVPHDINECDYDQTKRRRLITCSRCRKQSLVWHSCKYTGGRDSGHALFEALPDTGRLIREDTTKPHKCPGRFTPDQLPQPAGAEPKPEVQVEASGDVSERQVREWLREELDVFSATVAEGMNEALVARLNELALPAKTVAIEVKAGGEVRRIEGAHRQVPKLIAVVSKRDLSGYRFPVMLFGKPGVSKSYSAHQVADALGLSFGLISLNPQTPESRLFGFIDAGGRYHRTLFREAFENGGVYVIDEIDNASDALLTSLNSCLANGHGAFPDGMVKRHSDFICIATANTPGRGGDANHSGRRQLDAATINRFITINWLNDDELELKMAQAASTANGRLWLEWVRKVRTYCEAHHPRVIVSPRTTVSGAVLSEDPLFTLEEVADMTLFKGLDRDTRAKVLSACPLPSVRRSEEVA